LSLLSALFQRSFTTARGGVGTHAGGNACQWEVEMLSAGLGRHTAIPALVLFTVFAGPTCADVIADWNAKAEAIAIEKRLLPPPNAHGMAILHVAMFEAVNAVDHRYAPYKLKLAAARNVSKEAAAAAAAHAVLLALYPDQPGEPRLHAEGVARRHS
jgi:hypothetical protein